MNHGYHGVFDRAEQLIDLIDNRDYREIIDVQTIIVMSNNTNRQFFMFYIIASEQIK